MSEVVLDFMRSHGGRLLLNKVVDIQEHQLELLLQTTSHTDITSIAKARGRYEGVSQVVSMLQKLRGEQYAQA